MDYAEKVLDQATMNICKDAFSNLRLQVTNAWLKSPGQPLGCFRDCSETYLTAEEYEQVMSLFGNCVATSDIKIVIMIY